MQLSQHRDLNIVCVICDLKVGILFPTGFRDFSTPQWAVDFRLNFHENRRFKVKEVLFAVLLNVIQSAAFRPIP
jgi:hypothetical protein